MRFISSGEWWYLAFWVRVLIIQACFTVAFCIASVGVKMLPKDHPLRLYHNYSKAHVRPTYIKAARRLR